MTVNSSEHPIFPNLFRFGLFGVRALEKVYNELMIVLIFTANSTIVQHRRFNFFTSYIKMLATSEAPTYIENSSHLPNENYRFRPPTPETDSIRRCKTKSPPFEFRSHGYLYHGPGYFPKRSRNRCEEVST